MLLDHNHHHFGDRRCYDQHKSAQCCCCSSVAGLYVHDVDVSLIDNKSSITTTTKQKTTSWKAKLVMICAILLICCLSFASTAGDIAVKIERHFPCSPSSGPSKENTKIRFPSYKSPGVNFIEEKDTQGHKCFRMEGGKVEVFAPGLESTKKYYVHVEIRIGIHGKPERCVGGDKDGCGGIGSCVHCDICHSMGGNFRNFIQIYKNNEPAKCNAESFAPGSYDDLALRVCLPTKNELLPFLDQNSNRAEQLWDIFVSSRARSGGEIPLVIAARLFDRPVNKLSPKELNDGLHGSKKGMIGCHWIYATVSQK